MRIEHIIPGTPFTRALQWVVRAGTRNDPYITAYEFVRVLPDGAGGIMLEATDRHMIHRAQVPHFLLSDDWAREVAAKDREPMYLPRQAVAECAKSIVHFIADGDELTWWTAQDAQDAPPPHTELAKDASKTSLDRFFVEPTNAIRCSFDAGVLRKLCTGQGAPYVVIGDAGLVPSHLLCPTAEGGVIAMARLCPDDDADTLSALYESGTAYAGWDVTLTKKALMGVDGKASAMIVARTRGDFDKSQWQASPLPGAPAITRRTVMMGCQVKPATPAAAPAA